MALNFDGMRPIQIYRKGFEDGASSDPRFPDTINIMGYELSKLMEIIQDWELRQPKILFDNGSVRVTKVPEGQVVWANGEIIWKSWEHANKVL